MTKEELAAKVEWEGGLAEAVFGYGLTRDDMPEDAPTWIWANWQCLMDAKGALRRIEEWLGEDGGGGVSEPAGDSPDHPPAGESRVPGGSDDYLPVAPAGDDPADLWEHVIPGGYRFISLSPLCVSLDGGLTFHEIPEGTGIAEFLARQPELETKVPS